jgi:hypothetical protein
MYNPTNASGTGRRRRRRRRRRSCSTNFFLWKTRKWEMGLCE